MKLKLQKNHGIGLLELMLSLAIIAILLVTATRYYVITRTSQQVNEAAQMVNATFSAAEAFFQHDPIQDDMITKFVNDGTLPKEFANDNINPWGGALKATGSGSAITVTLTQVPTDPCNSLVEQFKVQFPTSTPVCDDSQNFNITFQLQ